MANGGCRRIKRAMAGNIMSEVRGLPENAAAQAKELKPTSRGTPEKRAWVVD
jgi:hypothetical protein